MISVYSSISTNKIYQKYCLLLWYCVVPSFVCINSVFGLPGLPRFTGLTGLPGLPWFTRFTWFTSLPGLPGFTGLPGLPGLLVYHLPV